METINYRLLTIDDALQLLNHKAITTKESEFLARYPEECNFKIQDIEAQMTSSICIGAFYEDKLVGCAQITQVSPFLKYKHRAYFAISIQEAYCNLGIGSHLLDLCIEKCKELGYEQLELGTFDNNTRAIHLYKKKGFTQYGVNPRAFKLKDGSYHDEVIMVLFLDTAS